VAGTLSLGSRRPFLALAALVAAGTAQAQTIDPDSPTCPPNPNWSANREMRLTVATVDGRHVLLAEGAIDDNLLPRLEAALRDQTIEEIRLRSPGGNARVGNQAGRMIRESGLPTRIPNGWACMGSCAFMFMGGIMRAVDPGGLVIVQMFTFTGDREAIRQGVAGGEETTEDLLTEIARRSARFASEDNDYLIRMGVSRALLTDIVYRQRGVQTPAGGSTRRCLTDAELRRYLVVNQGGPVR
jgi:hypothetical protein